eukprot:COSAG03_NODE_25771_length_263_cov_0.951220_1_plen_73_part_10
MPRTPRFRCRPHAHPHGQRPFHHTSRHLCRQPATDLTNTTVHASHAAKLNTLGSCSLDGHTEDTAAPLDTSLA